MKKISNYIIYILIISNAFTQLNIVNRVGTVSNKINFSGEPYVTGDDGIVRMYVNIIGHVKNPGTYLVYEGIDIFSLLSLAGGPLPGAKLSAIKHFNGEKVNEIDFENIIESGDDYSFNLYPHNTLYVKQTLGSYLFSNSSLINSTLQVMNIVLTILRTN